MNIEFLTEDKLVLSVKSTFFFLFSFFKVEMYA